MRPIAHRRPSDGALLSQSLAPRNQPGLFVAVTIRSLALRSKRPFTDPLCAGARTGLVRPHGKENPNGRYLNIKSGNYRSNSASESRRRPRSISRELPGQKGREGLRRRNARARLEFAEEFPERHEKINCFDPDAAAAERTALVVRGAISAPHDKERYHDHQEKDR